VSEEFTLSGTGVECVAFVADGAITLGHNDGKVSLVSSETGEFEASFSAHRRTVVAVAYTPDGTILATGGQEGLTKLWDTKTLKEIVALKGHLKSIHSLAMSPDGRRLATGGSGQAAVKLWDVQTHQELITLQGSSVLLQALHFSPDNNALIGLTGKAELTIWSIPSWGEIKAAETQGPGGR
jgi:WD40 repeat protein